MSWWEWLLVSIGLYTTAGITCALGGAYYFGRTGGDMDGEDYAYTLILWPIILCVLTLIAPYEGCKWLVRRGRSHHDRKQARLEKKQTDRDFAEMCRDNGLDAKKVKAHLGL